MSSYNSTYEERLAATITYVPLYLSAIFCSGLIIFITFRTDLYKTRVNLLLVNLAIADFVLNVSGLLLQTPNVIAEQKSLTCSFVGFTDYVCGVENVIFVPIVAVNRFMALCHQHAFKRVFTSRNINIIIFSSWSLVITLMLPFLIAGRTGYELNYENCGVNNEDSTVWTVLIILIVVVPNMFANNITAYCSYRIFRKLKEHSHNKSLSSNIISKNKQVIYVTFSHTLSALCLQMPYGLGKLIPSIVHNSSLRVIFPALYCLNGTVAPLLTLWVVKPYREAAKKYLRYKQVTDVTTVNVPHTAHSSNPGNRGMGQNFRSADMNNGGVQSKEKASNVQRVQAVAPVEAIHEFE